MRAATAGASMPRSGPPMRTTPGAIAVGMATKALGVSVLPSLARRR